MKRNNHNSEAFTDTLERTFYIPSSHSTLVADPSRSERAQTDFALLFYQASGSMLRFTKLEYFRVVVVVVVNHLSETCPQKFQISLKEHINYEFRYQFSCELSNVAFT